MIFIGTVLSAQNSKIASIYSQIPPPPEKFTCENSHDEEMDLLASLMEQLEDMAFQLEEELAISREKTNATLAAAFPTAEELARVEKLPESEQRAFWKKIEDDQAGMSKTVESNKLKYKAEKESLKKKVEQYLNESPENIEYYLEVYHKAGTAKSQKVDKIESNPAIKNKKQQVEAACVEFCTIVSPILLKNIRYEYAHLKQNMIMTRRLSVIELAEYSTLTEEELKKQHAAMLDLTDVEMLKQFINDYMGLYDVLPGQMFNQR